MATMDHSIDAMKYMLEQQWIKTHTRHVLGEPIPLPAERKISAGEAIPHTRLMSIEAHQREQFIRSTLANNIAATLAVPGHMDITRFEDHMRFEDRFEGSVYVFNKEQLQSFIRDIEDAVKESLST